MLSYESQTAPSALPPQGAWSDEAYLRFTDHTRRLIEFTDGWFEELPPPTSTHQMVLLFLYDTFHAYLRERGGVVMAAALRMRIRPGKFREPDLLLLLDRDDPRNEDRYWLGAIIKAEHSEGFIAGVGNPVFGNARFGVVGAFLRIVSVRIIGAHHLGDEVRAYQEFGVHGRGDIALSPSMPDFRLDVAAMFGAPKPTR